MSKEATHEEDIQRTLELLHPDGLFEIRALGTQRGTWSGYFTSPVKAAQIITKWANTNTYEGIYVTLNELHRGLLARAPNMFRIAGDRSTTSDTDVLRRRWFLVDVDAIRPAGISSTDQELEISRILRDEIASWFACNWPGKLIKACSGNGSHLLFEALEDVPKEELKSLLEHLPTLIDSYEIRRMLELVKIDTAVHNAARITKLYGTFARKGFEIASRPHRKSEIEGVIDGRIKLQPTVESSEVREPECTEVPDESSDWLEGGEEGKRVDVL